MRFRFIIIFGFPLLFVPLLWAQNSLEISSIHSRQVKMAGFTLQSDKNIHLDVVGAGWNHPPRRIKNMMQDKSGMFVYAWIIDAQSRKQVWRMTVKNTRRKKGSDINRFFRGDIRLPKGDYIAFFSAQPMSSYGRDGGFFSLGRLLDKLLRGKDYWQENEADWHLVIQGVDEVSDESELEKYHKVLREKAVVSIYANKNSDFRQEGFTLKKAGEFDIYAIGEAYKGEEFDYGWIVKADNDQKIWEMDYEESASAGGAVKNRVWRERIHLEPGSYWVYFVTDDSHSPERWNANPPFDPLFWGITIRGVQGQYDPRSVVNLVKLKVNPIVELIGIHDDAEVEQGFQIDRKMKVRVYCLGEGSTRKREMDDYGWIVDAETGDTVWRMRYSNSRHAGGASKNRLVDEIITLDPGKYIVYYKTDDSHSYPHFNAAPPYNPRRWGITIYPADSKYSQAKIRHFTALQKSEDVIVKIIRVRNDERVRKQFTLTHPQKVRIYAIGEGDWDEMYDYGWIKNRDSDKIVWKMTYDQTRWAGGAKKNRKVNKTLKLPAGRYVVVFVTDDSHSYNQWNSNPPDDPINYGITIFKVK